MLFFTCKENWEMPQDSDLFLLLLIVGRSLAVCIATEVSAAFKSTVFETRIAHQFRGLKKDIGEWERCHTGVQKTINIFYSYIFCSRKTER